MDAPAATAAVAADTEDRDASAEAKVPLAADVAALLTGLDAAKPVHVGRAAVRVRQARTVRIAESSVTHLGVPRSAAIGPTRLETKEETAWTETVRATQGGAATALEVGYLTAKSEVEADGHPQFAPARRTTGHTYRVSRRGSDLVVVTDQGKAVKDDVAALVKADFGSLGQPDPFWTALPADFAVGARSERVEHALQHVLEQGLGDARITELSATCRGVRDAGATAVFEVELQFSNEQEASLTDSHLLGALLMGTARGDVERIVLAGPLRGHAASSATSEPTVHTGGTMHWEWKATPSP